MSASQKLFTSCFFLLASSVSSIALAQTGGIIHFEGMIVESPCDVNVKSHNVVMACYREGEIRTRTMNINTLTQDQQGVQNVATMKMNYINPAHTLAILDIVYN